MNKKKVSFEKYMKHLEKVAAKLTQEQVDACAWAISGGGDWTPKKIEDYIKWSNQIDDFNEGE